jgi:hypothetical protein
MRLGRSPGNDEGGMRNSHVADVSKPHTHDGPAPAEAALPLQKKQPLKSDATVRQPSMPQHGRA